MLSNLSKAIRLAINDRRGNMTMLFGFCMIVIFGAVGISLDYARAHMVHEELQRATDAAALAAAASRNLPDAERLRIALKAFAADANDSPLTAGVTPIITIGTATNGAPGHTPPAEGSVVIEASKTIPTLMLSILDRNLVDIRVKTTAQSTGKILDMGMMIDLTGSMADMRNGTAKIDALKAAAADLLDIVLPDNQPAGLSRVGIAPFAQYVNAGPYAQAVTGLAPTGTYMVPNGNNWWNNWGNNWSNNCNGNNCTAMTGPLVSCVTERVGADAYSDAAPGPGAFVGAPSQGQPSTYDYSADGVCNVAGRVLPEVIPMTSDKSALLNAIQSFTVGGSTPGQIGTAWAWYLISPSWAGIWPAGSQPLPFDNKTLKVVVLMTDGEYNTQYSAVDSKTQALAVCSGMKSEGVVVFTIGFGLVNGNPSDDIARNTLQTCATDSSHFFFPYDGTELRTVFRNIGQQIAAAQGGTRITN